MWDGHLRALAGTYGPAETGSHEPRTEKHGTPLLPTSYTISTPLCADPGRTHVGNRVLRERFPSRLLVAQPTLSPPFSARRLPRHQLIYAHFVVFGRDAMYRG